MATEVTAKGTSNYEFSKKYENLIDKNDIEFLPSNAVLKTIKSEFKYNARISKDLYFDAEASKVLCQKLCLFSHETQLKGYVQEIGQNPFGLLLMSNIQVQAWKIIRKSNLVLYFDATSSVLVPVLNQKRPFLYSIVSHDKINRVIFPIAEFLSTAHDSLTISKYLLSIKHHLKESDFESAVRIVVTDFSWALMVSVIHIFNGCSIMAYLTWCLDHLFGLGIYSSSIKTIHIHCCIHTLKNVIRKSKKIKCEPKIRNCFVFCFSLLQNAIQPQDFEAILINIYSLFNQKFSNKDVLLSLSFLRDRI